MSISTYELMIPRIKAWHEARFPLAEQVHVACKVGEEVGEVLSAVLSKVGKNSATGKGDVAGEAADVIIALTVLLARWYPEVNLMAEVAAKVAVLENPFSGHRASACDIGAI